MVDECVATLGVALAEAIGACERGGMPGAAAALRAGETDWITDTWLEGEIRPGVVRTWGRGHEEAVLALQRVRVCASSAAMSSLEADLVAALEAKAAELDAEAAGVRDAIADQIERGDHRRQEAAVSAVRLARATSARRSVDLSWCPSFTRTGRCDGCGRADVDLLGRPLADGSDRELERCAECWEQIEAQVAAP